MAGSLTYRAYVADSAVPYSIKIDESNARAAVTGGSASPLCGVRIGNFPAPPQGLKKRYVLCFNAANPNERRKFTVGDTTLIAAITAPGATLTAEDYPGTNDAPGTNVTWVITAYRGERSRTIPSITATDTGLTDGTPGQ